MKKKYSILSLIKNAFSNNENWEKMWESPEPKKGYDVMNFEFKGKNELVHRKFTVQKFKPCELELLLPPLIRGWRPQFWGWRPFIIGLSPSLYNFSHHYTNFPIL